VKGGKVQKKKRTTKGGGHRNNRFVEQGKRDTTREKGGRQGTGKLRTNPTQEIRATNSCTGRYAFTGGEAAQRAKPESGGVVQRGRKKGDRKQLST